MYVWLDDGDLLAIRDFASNVGIEFKTPEEYFLHEEPLPFTRTFEPGTFLDPALTTSTDASKTPCALPPKSDHLAHLQQLPSSSRRGMLWILSSSVVAQVLENRHFTGRS